MPPRARTRLSFHPPPLPALLTQVLHLFHELSFATWFGSMSYTTFVVGIALFKCAYQPLREASCPSPSCETKI